MWTIQWLTFLASFFLGGGVHDRPLCWGVLLFFLTEKSYLIKSVSSYIFTFKKRRWTLTTFIKEEDLRSKSGNNSVVENVKVRFNVCSDFILCIFYDCLKTSSVHAQWLLGKRGDCGMREANVESALEEELMKICIKKKKGRYNTMCMKDKGVFWGSWGIVILIPH